MSDESGSKSFSQNRITTLIGAGMRIEGDISCNGVLRVQGSVLGNVSCDGSSNASLIVDTAGEVTGAVNVTHLVVRGRVIGPVQSSQSIEVHQGACVLGDVSFKEMAIHAGGVVEGLLHSPAAIGCIGLPEAHHPHASPGQAAKSLSVPPDNRARLLDRVGRAGRISAVAAFAVIAVTIAWMSRSLIVNERSAENAVVEADPVAKGTNDLRPAIAEIREAKNDPNVIAGEGAPLGARPSADAKDVVQPAAPGRPAIDQDKAVTVNGANPNRPAGILLLVSTEQSVLYRKKRDDPANGDRIAVSKNEKVSISIAPDDLIRVAEGKDLTILYQGRKVSRSIIESGAWISFVPK